MPELPEIETIVQDLEQSVVGATIQRLVVTKADVLREATARQIQRRVAGATITRCWRRAKLAIVELSSGDRLVVQPRFTGALLVDTGSLDDRERQYSTLRFELADGRALHYRDIRRLGTVTLMAPDRFAAYSAALGIEPLDQAFTARHLSGLLRASGQAVKKVIMNQRRVVGIGNIYANEALWRAGIDPSRDARRVGAEEAAALRDAIVDVLTEAIEARGTSFRDYRDARGEAGGFESRLAVYGRERKPCRRCGTRLVGTHAIDGRATVLCPRCQR